MNQAIVDIVKIVAAKYYPINKDTGIIEIPYDRTCWSVPILKKITQPPNYPYRGGVITTEEIIDLTHVFKFAPPYSEPCFDSVYRYGYGSITNTLIVREEKQSVDFHKSHGNPA